jgi:hypothetical protein
MAIKGTINQQNAVGSVIVQPTIIKGTTGQQGTVGKVVVRPINQTTISTPNFTPKLNIALSDIQGVNIATLTNGYSLIYDSSQNEFVSKPINTADIEITNINGGRF